MSITLRMASGALGALIALPALAQQGGTSAAGKELASKLCSNCHIVGTERAGSDIAPPFPILARDPETTLTELHGWVHSPMHPVLSNLALTPGQISNINAYLDSLRPGAAPAAGSAPTMTDEPAPSLENAPPEKLGEPIEVTPE